MVNQIMYGLKEHMVKYYAVIRNDAIKVYLLAVEGVLNILCKKQIMSNIRFYSI